MSEGLAQSPYVAAEVGLEPATLRTQVTEFITEPPCPTILSLCLRSQSPLSFYLCRLAYIQLQAVDSEFVLYFIYTLWHKTCPQGSWRLDANTCFHLAFNSLELRTSIELLFTNEVALWTLNCVKRHAGTTSYMQ